MAANDNSPYEMTVSLNVLKHLGFGLYSNVPAVLAEVVANSWDADATEVSIDIDRQENKITISDNGHGMTVEDANKRYLDIGYERRNTPGGGHSPEFGRPVMGRKGIGKLSLFSIAKTVEIQSVRNGQQHGFVMDADAIERHIKEKNPGPYRPEAVPAGELDVSAGTQITLTRVKRRLHRSSDALRRRLARRFSIIGSEHNFRLTLDGAPITIYDRAYHDRVQYIWTYGEKGQELSDVASDCELSTPRDPDLADTDPPLLIDGWIATATESGRLKDKEADESLNRIVIMVRDKLAQEDVLEEFGEGGLYSKYVFGEIHANFLDVDDQEDIATTSRQRIIEGDPRYQALKQMLQGELKVIQGRWTELRNEKGKDIATAIPQIGEWYDGLSSDHKKAADRLFGKINQLPIEDAAERRQIFVSSILAFESLRFRSLLSRLDGIRGENLAALGDVFTQLDDLEASAYYQISHDRLEVIRKLESLTDGSAKEKAMQQHLYQHLWLLDPSWERATGTERMEKQFTRAIDEVYQKLPKDQRKARFDIRYATTANKHVIVELKKADRVVNTDMLCTQIRKYRAALLKVLASEERDHEPVEFVCIVGKPLSDWKDNPDGRETSAKSLAVLDARVVTYDALIHNAQQAYQDYLIGRAEAGRVHQLINSISVEDIEALRPSSE